MNALTNNLTPFIPDNYSKLCLLDTDIIEPELLVRKIADAVSEEYPECFQGEASLVFFRLRYTPPYEHFTELRRLILEIRQATGIRSRFRGMLCIDASEYKGHEDEEYFTILLKYLYDNAQDDAIVFVCSQYSEQEMEKLANHCMKYHPLHKEKLMLFEKERLSQLIESVAMRENVSFDAEALELLTTTLSAVSLKPSRSLQLIERVPRELCIHNPDKSHRKKKNQSISSKVILDYFSNASSPICIMAGRALLQERRIEIEHTL